MKRAAILGAAGFIGSHLTDRFLAEGWQVTGVDSYLTGSPKNLAHLAGEPRFDFPAQAAASRAKKMRPYRRMSTS